jgi:hypothetical protein
LYLYSGKETSRLHDQSVYPSVLPQSLMTCEATMSIGFDAGGGKWPGERDIDTILILAGAKERGKGNLEGIDSRG